PHVVPVYEAGAEGPVCYIASAYCPGDTLAEWLQQHRELLPYRAAAQLVATLAGAVHHAHERGVIHRDLKPSNILLAACGFAGTAETAKPQAAELVPKITDFGLAKLLDDEPGAEAAGRTQSGAI